MPRVVRVLVVLVMLGQATGISLADLVGDDDCRASCEDEGSGKTCPPACTTCSCTMRVATPMVASRSTMIVSVPMVVRMKTAPHQSVPSSPDPREILHVPKSHVA